MADAFTAIYSMWYSDLHLASENYRMYDSFELSAQEILLSASSVLQLVHADSLSGQLCHWIMCRHTNKGEGGGEEYNLKYLKKLTHLPTTDPTKQIQNG